MSLSFRYTFHLLKAFLLRFKGLILLGFIIGITIFLLINIIFPLLLGKSNKIGIIGKYRSDELPLNILKLVGEGLTKIDSSGSIEPGLAKSWETTDGGKTWIFHLKENIFWQNGEKIESYDLNYKFSDVNSEKPDSTTIIFKLQNPYTPFPSVVSQPIFKKGLLGSKEWKVDNISLSGNFVQRLTLMDKKRNKIIYKFYPTEDRGKLALKLGQIDTLEDIFNQRPFDEWRIFEVEKNTKSNQVVTLFFNTQDKYLSEKSLRQALHYALNKESFKEFRAISPISPDSWSYNPQVKPYNFDQEKAKSLIESLPEELKDNLDIKIVTTHVLLEIAEEISRQWKEVDVSSQVLVSSIIPAEYQVLLAIFEIPADPDQYTIWHSTQLSTNYAKYQNPRIDKLLEDGRSELSFEERRKIYLDFQRFLVEDAPAAFLFHPSLYTIKRK